jgi:MraZ protein
MLIGQYQATIGDKNRLALPKKFRAELGEKVIVTRWYEMCIVIVSIAHWQTLLQRLTGQMGNITLPIRDTDRFILGSAFEIELDIQGRFIIPAVLKEYARLKEEVIFLGLGDRIELWDKDEWGKRESYIEEHASQMLEEVVKNNA